MLTGIVQEVINNGIGKGSGLRVDGVKYGAYDPVKTGFGNNEIQMGDEVTFEWSQRGQYKNIMGRVTKTGNTGTPAPASASPKPQGRSGGKGYSRGVFPIPVDDMQRSIIRQNSVTNAVAIVTKFEGDDVVDAETAAKRVIEVAQILEEYSAGDIDARMVEEATKQLQVTNE